MTIFDFKQNRSPAQHIHSGHDVVVRVVGAEELVICLACDNLVLKRTPLPETAWPR